MTPTNQPRVAAVRQVDHLNLTVRNLEQSLTFYRELFGFRVVERGRRDDDVPWAIARSGEAMLCLYEFPELPTGPSFPERPVQQGMSHFALRISNGPDFLALLGQRGIPLLFDGPVQWPHSTSLYIVDPTGHHVEVVCWNDDTIAFDPLD
jgi:catechol 2,3-dioxygenase